MFIKISEQPSLYNDLEKKSVHEILVDINREDQKVALAIQKTIPQIEKLVTQIVPRMKQGGRIFYMGAGTSGRLGVLDASEIPPTFGMPPTLVIGLIAGGDTALRNPVENAEDDMQRGWEELVERNITDKDIIDTRFNGGGRLHEDIEILFSGQKYFTQVVRGREACDMPSRRWNKPSIMVMCEANYSNAHGTPWVYSHRGIGKLVGMPVPGTMTSVSWERLQDPSLVFGIPVVGYRLG